MNRLAHTDRLAVDCQARALSHVPVRTCLGCRNRFPKNQLIRLAIDSNGVINMDLEGKYLGRGAYTCSCLKCVEQITGENDQSRRKSAQILSRSLRKRISEKEVAELNAILLKLQT